MELVIHITLALLIASAAVVQSDSGIEDADLKSEEYTDLKSAASRQKIYDIISSHEDRKYGDHGGHEYEEGEVPRKSGSRQSKRYGYQPDESNYYYLDQPKHSNAGYLPKAPVADNVYVDQPKHSNVGYLPKAPVVDNVHGAPNVETVYASPKGRYPIFESSHVEPKKGYLTHDTAYAVPKRPVSVYITPKAAKERVYRENVGGYLEDKTAPITIGKTARTIYPKPLSNSHYSVVDSKHPSEYVVLEGQNPPRPLILDPKLKETYHYTQPEAHYSAPEHQVILKPKISVPAHYPTPVKEFDDHYYDDDDHHKTEKGHHSSGHGYYDDNAVKKESGYKSHGNHDISGHKAHSAVAAKHDEHGHHHNKGLYERDRGYHYEKAYAYDRVRSHHDIGSNQGSHSSYGAHHGQQGHKDSGHHGAETYRYFKKDDHGAGYGYNDGNSLYKKGGYYGHKYYPTYYHG